MRPVSREKNTSTGLLVDDDVAFTGLHENTRDRTLAAAGAIVVLRLLDSHEIRPLISRGFGLLRGVRVFGARIHFHLFQHRIAERPFRQHALHCHFEHALRMASPGAFRTSWCKFHPGTSCGGGKACRCALLPVTRSLSALTTTI